MQTRTCATCDTRDRSVFCELVPRELEEIASAKATKNLDRGDMLFFDGDRPSGIYCVSEGTIKIFKMGRDGREQILRLARPGDVIGYRALLSGDAHSSSAAAMDGAQVCFVPRAVFFSLIEHSPATASRVLALLSAELRKAEDRMVDMAQRPVRERVAETLLLLKESGGVDEDGKTLNIRITRAEIGSIVGAATESVIRLLAEFKKEGLVEFVGRRIAIMDHQALLAAAQVDD
jgi:CRP/FNR family transcriptional regulator